MPSTQPVSFQARKRTLEPQPAHSIAHDLLDVFVGTWTAEGRTEPGANTPAEDMRHTHKYTWLPGRFHLYHSWKGQIGAHESDGVEVIGYDASRRVYCFHFFDSDGWVRVYHGQVHDSVWTLTGDRERCTMTLSDDRQSMTTNWERSPDGNVWDRLCIVKAKKTSSGDDLHALDRDPGFNE